MKLTDPGSDSQSSTILTHYLLGKTSNLAIAFREEVHSYLDLYFEHIKQLCEPIATLFVGEATRHLTT